MRAISPRKQRIFPFRESIHLAYLAIGLTSPSLSWGIHEPETLVPLEPRMMNFSESLASKTRNAYLDLKKNSDLDKIISDSQANVLNISQRIVGPSNIETTKFQHYYKGIEVIGSMAFHHVTDQGTLIQNRVSSFELNTSPTLSVETAAALAQGLHSEMNLKSQPQLRILPSKEEGRARLIYWIELKGKGLTGGQDILLDAQSGQVIAELSHDHTLAPIQIYSAYKQGHKITPSLATNSNTGKKDLQSCTLEKLEDGSTQKVTLDSCKLIYQGESPLTQSQCQVIDGMQGFPVDLHPKACTQMVKDSVMSNPSDPAVLRAASNSKKVLTYFSTRFGRNSYDNQGTDLVSIIHAGDHMANAFWTTDLNTMVYGDGDGNSMGDLTQSVDVAGHEMTHGVTSKTADFLMMGESGALSEAFSDFFGKRIENQDNWVVGNRLFLDPQGPQGIRDLADPHHLKDHIRNAKGDSIEKPYPSSVEEQANVGAHESCDESNDHCWIHHNSTIPSHASYLVTKVLGAEKAELLYYTALTQNLTSTDNFKTAALAIISTCQQLGYTHNECSSVRAVYLKVGILTS